MTAAGKPSQAWRDWWYANINLLHISDWWKWKSNVFPGMENTSGFFIGNLILMKSVVRCFSIFNGALLQLCAPNCVSWPGDGDGDGDRDGAEAALLDAAAILTSQSRLISADKPWLMVLKLYKHICVSSMSPVLHDQILIRGRCCFKVPTSTVGGGGTRVEQGWDWIAPVACFHSDGCVLCCCWKTGEEGARDGGGEFRGKAW